MAKGRILPLALGAAIGAASAYVAKSARKAELSAHLPMNRFDKELQPMGRVFRADPLFRNVTPQKLRLAGNLSQKVPLPEFPELRHTTQTIGGRGGAITVHILSPLEATGNLPVVEWIHGGGYVMNGLALDMDLARKLIAAAPSVFVLPEYRLSTDASAPAAAEDCYDCLLWIKDNAERIGGRTDQIFVGGTCAGGGIACAVTQMARDWGKVNIAYQMPLYPMLDDRMITASARDNDAPWWNSQMNAAAWQLYLGDAYGTDEVTKAMAPARETNFAGLPPAYSFVGSLDPFADETIAYFSQLRQAGVHAFLDIYPKAYHLFDLLVPNATVSKVANHRLCAAYKRAVYTFFAAND
jgi:acetyl esterase/lipase